MKYNLFGVILILGLALLLAGNRPAFVSDGGLTPSQARGQMIYTTGQTGNGEEITALMSGVTVPASVMPCINCHGEQGQGKPEGGVSPSNLTWPSLTRNYSGEKKNGRTHPPYNEKSLVKAISMGLDPAGNKLEGIMPRYQMSQQAMEDLISYLKVIGTQGEAGVLDNEIRIGILSSPQKEQALVMEGVLKGFCQQINSAGGLYGRNLSVHPCPARLAADPDSLGAFIERENIFAFCGSRLEQDPREVVARLNALHVPLVGAITGEEPPGILENREVFYLLPGTFLEARGLLDLAGDSLEVNFEKVALLTGGPAGKSGTHSRLKQACMESGLGKMQVQSWEGNPENLKKLQEKEMKALLLADFTGEAIPQLLQDLDGLDWHPWLLVTSNQAAPAFLNAPDSFRDRILIAYPTWLTVVSPEMEASFDEFARKNSIPPFFLQTQYAVLASGILLSEALRACGRELTRSRLKEELEKIQALPTGLVPPLTYGISRRTGSQRIFIVTPEPGNQALRLVQERSR
ncbi:MAG: ABC transporter substrate-binding protein [Bacteroidia bacterium]|nr:ABC transporter substrate-binding protein [Bacteroidia bacterium]